MLGTAGGLNGTGISGPQSANIQTPTTDKQAQTAYTGNQQALAQQQNFLNAVQAQNGLGNQSSVYNQLQGITNGTGPNPAQAQLAQATGANVANQAALMAGQRGSNANVGLIARQAAQQGSQIQQQAAGQAATLQAQQSLAALQNQGNIANTQAGQQAAATGAVTGAQQTEQANLLNSIAQQNNAAVGMQSNVNSANAGLAGTIMGQQGQVAGGLMNGAGALSSMFASGGEISQPAQPGITPVTTPQLKSNQAQSSLAKFVKGATGDGSQKMTGAGAVGQGIGKGIAAGAKALFGSSKQEPSEDEQSGGLFTAQAQRDENQASALPLYPDQMANGGGVTPPPDQIPTTPDPTTMPPPQQSKSGGGSSGGGGLMSLVALLAQGGNVPALVSPGEQYLPPKDVKKVAKGANPLKVGEKIPGKPKYKGNDYRNDTVPKELEAGGIVIPNKVMQSKNPHWEAMKFVHATIAKNRKGLPSKGSK